MFLIFLFLFGVALSQQYQQFNVTTKTFLDIEIDGRPEGRIVLGLYGEVAPFTSENFRGLCTGEYEHPKKGTPLTYKGKKFHRIIPHFVVQGGNVGYSIYGQRFDDETHVVSQNRPGILVMANRGKNTNQAQFYITTANVAYLDKKLVAFGTVLEGMDVVYKMDMCGTKSGVPKCNVTIADSGEIPFGIQVDKEKLRSYVPPLLRQSE